MSECFFLMSECLFLMSECLFLTSECLFLTSECLFLISESSFIWVYNQTLPIKPNLSESLFPTSGCYSQPEVKGPLRVPLMSIFFKVTTNFECLYMLDQIRCSPSIAFATALGPASSSFFTPRHSVSLPHSSATPAASSSSTNPPSTSSSSLSSSYPGCQTVATLQLCPPLLSHGSP